MATLSSLLVGPTLLPYTVFVVVSLLFYRLKLAPGRRLLAGLNVFTLPNAKEAAQAAAAAAPAKGAGQVNRKKNKAGAVADVGSGMQLAISELKGEILMRLEFYDSFELVASILCVLAVTLAVTLGLEHAGLVAGPLNRACLGQTVPAFLAYVVICLANMEFRHPTVQRDDRIVICFLAAILAITALVLLAIARPRPIAFDAAAAAAEVASRWVPALRARFGQEGSQAAAALVARLTAPLASRVDGPGVALSLAAAGGAVGALLLGPGWRHGRLVAGTASPRPFESQYARLGALQGALLRAGFLANLVVCALWITPMVGVLRLTPEALHAARLGALAAAAAANLAALPALVQAYLNLGFTNWYMIRHVSGYDEAAKVRSADRQTRLVLILAAKVGLQFLLLPALQFAALALLLVHATPSAAAVKASEAAAARAAELAAVGGGGGGAAEAAAAAAAAAAASPLAEALQRLLPELAGPPAGAEAARAAAEAAARLAAPSALYAAVGGFVGWWATACFCAFSAVSLLLVRLGVTASTAVA
ncbi:hypothetical protein Rsub_03265 [Raphidocelis subcapitata]|uniref:Uncharacterized protein n=1 Tax=Raphidocelis subcapitata TaxID=307507 RepID=A0A2V0NTY0_9CHLO|nr:hypothetical protein Rsub_03265 [Raphidocelis subcapitata]|eukprot:GBF90132.1 hypothetical protein Rsub_03265 [Raphidocelis subcapitata]